MQKLKCLASAIDISAQANSTLEHNDVFLLIKFLLLDDQINLNNEGVTSGFVDDMYNRREQLVGLPVYVDVDRLLSGKTDQLGHLYDRQAGIFGTTQIGAMCSFERVFENGVTSIIAVARIPRRESDVCVALQELYNDQRLKFSFEIVYNPDYTIRNDGAVIIDANPDNYITAACVVTTPANPSSVALQMVAEVDDDKVVEATEEGEKEMEQEMIDKAVAEALASKEEEMAKVIAEKDAVIAERDAQIAELNNAIAENPFAKKDEESDEEEKKDEANAELSEKEEATAEEAVASEDKEEACAAAEEEQEDMKAEIEKLKAELEAANVIKAEYESMKAEKEAKELAENQAKAKSFAEKQGLDISDEAVSKAIADVDYKMIAELSMKMEEQPKEEKVAVASMACDGFEMKGGAWDDLLAPAQ